MRAWQSEMALESTFTVIVRGNAGPRDRGRRLSREAGSDMPRVNDECDGMLYSVRGARDVAIVHGHCRAIGRDSQSAAACGASCAI